MHLVHTNLQRSVFRFVSDFSSLYILEIHFFLLCPRNVSNLLIFFRNVPHSIGTENFCSEILCSSRIATILSAHSYSRIPLYTHFFRILRFHIAVYFFSRTQWEDDYVAVKRWHLLLLIVHHNNGASASHLRYQRQWLGLYDFCFRQSCCDCCRNVPAEGKKYSQTACRYGPELASFSPHCRYRM